MYNLGCLTLKIHLSLYLELQRHHGRDGHGRQGGELGGHPGRGGGGGGAHEVKSLHLLLQFSSLLFGVMYFVFEMVYFIFLIVYEVDNCGFYLSRILLYFHMLVSPSVCVHE